MIDFKSLVIGMLLTSSLFLFFGYSSSYTDKVVRVKIVNDDIDVNLENSRIKVEPSSYSGFKITE